jgi:hypothetical protein
MLAKCDKSSLLHLKSKFELDILIFSDPEHDFEFHEFISGHLVGLLGRGVIFSQGHYIHRIVKNRKPPTYINASSGIRNHDSRVPDVETVFGYTAQPLRQTLVIFLS